MVSGEWLYQCDILHTYGDRACQSGHKAWRSGLYHSRILESLVIVQPSIFRLHSCVKEKVVTVQCILYTFTCNALEN